MQGIYKNYGFDCFNFEGYEVTIMKYSDCLCCVNDLDCIRVNQEFMKLSENTQQWILYHELGHIYHRHAYRKMRYHKLYKFKRRLYSSIGLVVKEEREADLFAVNKLGKTNALKAIEETIKLFNSKELKTRRLLIKLFCI